MKCCHTEEEEESFPFNTITIQDPLKTISMLDSSRIIQATVIPVKKTKGKSNFFEEQLGLFQ